jgi:hypothetical protein
VREFRQQPGPVVRFYWCRWCEELFAYVGEGERGERYVASLNYNQIGQTWGWWKMEGSTTDVELVREAMAALPPPRSEWAEGIDALHRT